MSTVWLPLLVFVLSGPGAPSSVDREAWVMGTRLRVAIEASTAEAETGAAEGVLAAVERTEALLSTWRPSPMTTVNAGTVGATVAGPPELARLLADAERWARHTDRAFEPVVGALVDAWGVRSGGRTPDDDALRAALAASGPAAMSVDPVTGAATRAHASAWIDTGGFGKGAGLRAARTALAAWPDAWAVVDLGGQLLIHARPGRPAPVAVAHPRDRDVLVRTLRVQEGSIATSGFSERPGHILDPRTGRPAPGWGSVTVVHADPVAADALSTALFVMGPERGFEWAVREDVAALFLDTSGGALIERATPRMNDYLS